MPVLRPSPGLAAYALRSVPDLPNLVLALFLRPPGEIEGAIAKVLAEQQAGEPFLPVFLTNHPDFTPLREQRLAFEYFPFELDEAAAAPEPALGRLLRDHAGADHAPVGRPAGRGAVSAAAASLPRLRLADALLAQSRADEASGCSCPLAGAKDTATLVALASLYLAQGRLADAAACARTAIAAGPAAGEAAGRRRRLPGARARP